MQCLQNMCALMCLVPIRKGAGGKQHIGHIGVVAEDEYRDIYFYASDISISRLSRILGCRMGGYCPAGL